MLKLPKGLKKKKKKSKKDQELFTEEELEQYKRDQKAKQEAAAGNGAAAESEAPSDCKGHSVVESVSAKSETASNPSDDKEEWARFKLLTSGIDSIVHKTQDELSRIKQTSYFQREPTATEKKKLEEEEAAVREAERIERERLEALEREANRDKLAEAVVELSESEEESEGADDFFVTDYIDKVAAGEIGIIVPESPIDVDLGPDPFDTDYATKVIVGADKAKNPEKRLVSLGAAVEVLSGRVDRDHALTLSQPKKKIRKGIVNLLSEDEDHLTFLDDEAVTPEPPRTLLDDFGEDNCDIPDAPLDLSAFLAGPTVQQETKPKEKSPEQKKSTVDLDILAEFDTLQAAEQEEDDEFAELAAESFTKKDEVKLVVKPQNLLQSTGPVEENWSQFELNRSKPKRPPPPPGRPDIPASAPESDDEFATDGVDPFDTSYVATVVKEDELDDFDFDPRAGEDSVEGVKVLTQDDLLEGTQAKPTKPKVIDVESEDYDPFDTADAESFVQPKGEIKYLRQKEIEDDDFDPRAEDEPKKELDAASRKSSLTLPLHLKAVGFVVPSDRLLLGGNGAKPHKPLTPYYAPTETISEKSEDPFDTSFVPETKPTNIELKHLEEDLLASNLKHSISDPDFDPRALEEPPIPKDLLVVEDQLNIKVLTPAQESKDIVDEIDIDPFDTSVAANIGPGKTELKLLESELIEQKVPYQVEGVLDTLDDKQEIGIGCKVLTPQPTLPEEDPEEVEIDPFDTSFASANLAPGKTEIKLLESELIEQ